jgi:hypothetical protein
MTDAQIRKLEAKLKDITGKKQIVVKNTVDPAMLGGMKPADIVIKLKGLINNTVVLKKVVRMGLELLRATAVTSAMPKKYDRKAVLKWVNEYNKCFKH